MKTTIVSEITPCSLIHYFLYMMIYILYVCHTLLSHLIGAVYCTLLLVLHCGILSELYPLLQYGIRIGDPAVIKG